jgi:recombination protein RecA
LIGAHILAETQKKGGVAVYIDTETAVSTEFLEAIGVDINQMLYLHLETVEDIFSAIEEIVAKVRESDKERLVTILVDSLAAATTKVELEAEFDKDGWATSKAIILSKAMRKITQMIGRQRIGLVFTNQLRQKLGVMFGDPWTTSGGKALPFHASTRIRLKNVGQIKDKKNNTIGMKMRAQVIKNRLGPPMRHADFELYFESGIDNEGSWLKVMKEHRLVKQGGAWYTMDDHNGNEIKFQSKDWPEYLKDEDFKSHCYQMICDKVVLKYEKNFGIDDVIIEEEVSE